METDTKNKKKQNADEFETARNEIDELKQKHNNGELELWFFDEVYFRGS